MSDTLKMISRKTLQIGFGNSQWPFFGERSIVQFEDRAEGKCGEVIVYCGPHQWIAHRVLFKKRELGHQWYFTQGDSLGEPDGWIPEYRILGVVTPLFAGSVPRLLYFFWTKGIVQYFRGVWFLRMVFSSRVGICLGSLRSFVIRRPVFYEFFCRCAIPWKLK